jgi:hypothetical protein
VSLTPEQIKLLLAIPERKRGGRRKSGGIDATVRDHATWFKLAHKLFDEVTQEMPECSNPECPDDRPKARTVVAEVDGVLMCRYCFLSGWRTLNPNQQKLPT